MTIYYNVHLLMLNGVFKICMLEKCLRCIRNNIIDIQCCSMYIIYIITFKENKFLRT